MLQKLVPLLIFIVLVVFLGIGLTLDPREIPSPLINKPMPVFSLPQLKESDKTLSSTDFLSEVFLLNVWASWCVACRAEHPVLLDLSRAGVINIYGLNYKDKREEALRWLDYYGDPYTKNIHDLDGKLGIDFGVYGVPETFIIDHKGIIRYKHIGPVTEDILKNKLLPIIEQLKAVGL
ncbi:MAG: DsbE family thiol:disulfide interchange protein [Proteobacteria bacterium]|nr:DsbE family thiol:disulfide interchange protein [Pseudomonadota bacterium]MCH8977550.1 DsbE family thiol:disulfide interchange protein [Pseudomonadota bacterium]